jgi:NTP pyrophosphatase (non-canonical NTP hydrolase)
MRRRYELEEKVIQWSIDKNLTDPVKQTLKTVSEVGELADAIAKWNPEKPATNDIIDAIGDIEVTLIILKFQLVLSQDMPLKWAYDIIKERTGKTVNGTFIKDI